MGPHEQTLAKQAIRAGQPMPARVANAPELILGLELFIGAFIDLDSERNSGFAIGPIPWTKIKEYAQTFNFDMELTEDLIYYVKALDNDYMKKQALKAKAEAQKAKNKR